MNNFLVVIFAAFSTPCFAQSALPTGLTASCDRKNENVSNLQTAMNQPVAQACADQIKTSADSCLKEPVATADETTLMQNQMSGTSTASLKQNLQMAQTGYTTARDKYDAHAATCKEAGEKVKDTCTQMESSLKEALRSNGLNSDPLQAASVQQTSLQLQEQIHNVQNASAAAQKAMSDEQDCGSHQAIIYDNAVQKAQVSIDSATGTDGSNVAKTTATTQSGSTTDPLASGAKDQVVDKVKTATETSVASSLEGKMGTTLAGAAGKLSAVGGVGYLTGTMTNSDPVSTVTTLTQTGLKYTLPAAGEVLEGPLAAVPIIMTPTPVGTCSGRTVDPVQSYTSGCGISTTAGALANESAIRALSQR